MINQFEQLVEKLEALIASYHHSYRAFCARVDGLSYLRKNNLLTNDEAYKNLFDACTTFIVETDLKKTKKIRYFKIMKYTIFILNDIRKCAK
jgi:hypothetical protein